MAFGIVLSAIRMGRHAREARRRRDEERRRNRCRRSISSLPASYFMDTKEGWINHSSCLACLHCIMPPPEYKCVCFIETCNHYEEFKKLNR